MLSIDKHWAKEMHPCVRFICIVHNPDPYHVYRNANVWVVSSRAARPDNFQGELVPREIKRCVVFLVPSFN